MPKTLLTVSHHRQRPQSAECLPACVAMVLDYLGQSVDYDTLVSLLRTRPALGTAAANVRYLETLGLKVRLHHYYSSVLFQRILEASLYLVFLW
jgi:ABC-type bacteriocin/lantibiotic exporter with double-glycine peptidase domain